MRNSINDWYYIDGMFKGTRQQNADTKLTHFAID